MWLIEGSGGQRLYCFGWGKVAGLEIRSHFFKKSLDHNRVLANCCCLFVHQSEESWRKTWLGKSLKKPRIKSISSLIIPNPSKSTKIHLHENHRLPKGQDRMIVLLIKNWSSQNAGAVDCSWRRRKEGPRTQGSQGLAPKFGTCLGSKLGTKWDPRLVAFSDFYLFLTVFGWSTLWWAIAS